MKMSGHKTAASTGAGNTENELALRNAVKAKALKPINRIVLSLMGVVRAGLGTIAYNPEVENILGSNLCKMNVR
jgi:hypothetical protein